MDKNKSGSGSKSNSEVTIRTTLSGQELTLCSTWGLFSPTEVDRGTRLLLDHLEVKPSDTALDVGCGYGAIGLTIAKLAPQGVVHLVDKDFVAISYAERNARVNHLTNAKVYASNMLSAVPENAQFDLIVSNPPAQVGKELLTIMLRDSLTHLKPGGRIYLVTVSGLREFIKRHLMDVFGNYEKLKQGANHTVARAIKM
ncbi:MAG: class I SAM-dependent methyltransferase [Candidatus Liptonbacteria bacterium]|nr:class I SAM-dependent methyltransferase [Candidatus Liptonbacteria bacterium]